MRDETFLVGLAIIALLILECWALYLGYDGAFFFPVVSVIAGLVGYHGNKLKDFYKEKTK